MQKIAIRMCHFHISIISKTRIMLNIVHFLKEC